MITALCANPCVDNMVEIDRFAYGGMNRIRAARQDGSGKGVNVALVAAQLGMRSACVGFLARERGDLVLDRLRGQGCSAEFVRTPGAVRVNTKVLDRSSGVVTELNEAGVPVAADAVNALTQTVLCYGAQSDYFVLTGSLPPGCPVEYYRTLTERLKQSAPGCRVVLDAEGEKLAEGLKALPFMTKPNRYEMELLCGRELPAIEDVDAEAVKLARTGIAVVAVSLGGEGAYVTDGEHAWYAPAMPVQVRSTVGAGDSMVAGMLLGLSKGLELAEAFRYGVAAATSSVTTEGTLLVDAALFEEYIPKIEIRQVR